MGLYWSNAPWVWSGVTVLFYFLLCLAIYALLLPPESAFIA